MIFVNTKSISGSIVNVHLNSGEDIIGTVEFDAAGNYVIARPTVPNVMVDEGGKFRVGLLPLRPYLGNLEEVRIPADRVAYAVVVPEQMSKLYTQFTSNIYLASAGEMPKIQL